MYMKLVMDRDDLTALNYLQYFVQENILNDSPVTEVSEKSREELKKAVAIVDSIVCIGVNLQESDCEIRLGADEMSKTEKKQIDFDKPYVPWTYTEISKAFEKMKRPDYDLQPNADAASFETKVPCPDEAKDSLETLKENTLKDDEQKLLLKEVIMNFFERNEAPKKVLLDMPSTSN